MESCQARSVWRRMQDFPCKMSTAMISESAVFEDRRSDNGLRIACDGAVTAVPEKSESAYFFQVFLGVECSRSCCILQKNVTVGLLRKWELT
jgi:hypothetical protein